MNTPTPARFKLPPNRPWRWHMGRIGGTPTPQKPWTQRRLELIQKIHERGDQGLAVNVRWCLKTNTGEHESKDARRLIDEGYALLTHKASPGKRSASVRGGGGKHYKFLRLTEKGLALLPPTQAVVDTGGPYAKRRAALAEQAGPNNA